MSVETNKEAEDSQEDAQFTHKQIASGPDGGGLFVVEFDDSDMAAQFENHIASKEAVGSNDGMKFTPESGEKKSYSDVGPINRATGTMTFPSAIYLEQLAKTNHELSSTINRLVDEVFRDDFPVLEPSVEDADDEERDHIENRLKSVNKAGQSLHSLMKNAQANHARLGVGMIKVRRDYFVLDGRITSRVKELVAADPKRIVPVTNKRNKIGGLYACRLHRNVIKREKGVCEECGCSMEEVVYAETETVGSNSIEQVFFDDEIISWSFHNSMLSGRDGLPPSAGCWKQALLLDMFRNYIGQYFGTNTGAQFPNTLLFITTDSADTFNKQMKEAKDGRQESIWEQGSIIAENAEIQVQKVDMTPPQIISDRKQLVDEYKSDIRNAYGIPALLDDDEESSSLASGSKGLSALSRRVTSIRTDLQREVLPEIEDALGMEDWELTFTPDLEDEEKQTGLETAKQARHLKEAGVPFRIVDNKIQMVDTDSPIDAQSDESEDSSSSELDREGFDL